MGLVLAIQSSSPANREKIIGRKALCCPLELPALLSLRNGRRPERESEDPVTHPGSHTFLAPLCQASPSAPVGLALRDLVDRAGAKQSWAQILAW